MTNWRTLLEAVSNSEKLDKLKSEIGKRVRAKEATNERETKS